MKAILVISLLFFLSCGKKKSTEPVDEPATEPTVSAPFDETADQGSTEPAPADETADENLATEETPADEVADQSSTTEAFPEAPAPRPSLPPTPEEEAVADTLSQQEIAQMNRDYCNEPVTFCMSLCNNPRQKQYLFFDSVQFRNALKRSEVMTFEGCQRWCSIDMAQRSGCKIF